MPDDHPSTVRRRNVRPVHRHTKPATRTVKRRQKGPVTLPGALWKSAPSAAPSAPCSTVSERPCWTPNSAVRHPLVPQASPCSWLPASRLALAVGARREGTARHGDDSRSPSVPSPAPYAEGARWIHTARHPPRKQRERGPCRVGRRSRLRYVTLRSCRALPSSLDRRGRQP